MNLPESISLNGCGDDGASRHIMRDKGVGWWVMVARCDGDDGDDEKCQ